MLCLSSSRVLVTKRAASLPVPVLQLVAFSSSSSSRSASTSASASSLPPSAAAKYPSVVPGRYIRETPVHRDLPEIKSRTPVYLAVVGIAALTWGGFLFYATNNERANSSIVRSLQFQLKASPAVTEFLGDDVRLVPILGEFKRVDGSINMLAGKIDVQFRVTGSRGKGTATFTSVRKGKAGRFEVLRWNITRDDGVVLDLANQADPSAV